MKLTVAALQLAFTDDTAANIRAVAELVREAAGKGAEVVLPPELFEGPYFCRVEDESLFATVSSLKASCNAATVSLVIRAPAGKCSGSSRLRSGCGRHEARLQRGRGTAP
jgi:predicted amidohydrolase